MTHSMLSAEEEAREFLEQWLLPGNLHPTMGQTYQGFLDRMAEALATYRLRIEVRTREECARVAERTNSYGWECAARIRGVGRREE